MKHLIWGSPFSGLVHVGEHGSRQAWHWSSSWVFTYDLQATETGGEREPTLSGSGLGIWNLILPLVTHLTSSNKATHPNSSQIVPSGYQAFKCMCQREPFSWVVYVAQFMESLLSMHKALSFLLLPPPPKKGTRRWVYRSSSLFYIMSSWTGLTYIRPYLK